MPLALPAVAVGLSLILTWLVLYGMHHGSNVWLRTLVEEFAKPRGGFFKRVALSPLRLIARGVLRVERWVRARIAAALLATELAVVGWLNGLADLAIGLGREIADLGEGLEAGIRDLTTRWIPRYINKALNPVERLAGRAWRLGNRVDRYAHAEAARLRRGIDTLRRDVARDIARARRGIEAGIRTKVLGRLRTVERALGRVVSRDLPRIRVRERALERAVYGRLTRRLTRLEKLLGIGVISAVVIRTLARVAPWLFCRNVNRLGRAVCGLNSDAVTALIAGLVGTLAIRDYRTLVRLMTDAEREAIDEVRRLLSVD